MAAQCHLAEFSWSPARLPHSLLVIVGVSLNCIRSRCIGAQRHVMDLPPSHSVTSTHGFAACIHSMHCLHSFLPSISERARHGLTSNLQHTHGAVCRQLTHRPYQTHLPQTLSHKIRLGGVRPSCRSGCIRIRDGRLSPGWHVITSTPRVSRL